MYDDLKINDWNGTAASKGMHTSRVFIVNYQVTFQKGLPSFSPTDHIWNANFFTFTLTSFINILFDDL